MRPERPTTSLLGTRRAARRGRLRGLLRVADEGSHMTFPGEGLLIKLWETLVEKGIGGLLKPWQAKREGLAQLELRRAELVGLAAAERDAEDIRAGRKPLDEVAGRYVLRAPVSQDSPFHLLSLPLLDSPQIVEISIRGLLSDAIRREVNVAKAIAQAEMELKDDPLEAPTRSIDDDWLFRWRDYAGAVSSEQLQSLWGKLLAGELKSPGSNSLRALEFLKNLSPDDATDIARLACFVVAGVIVVRSQQAILDIERVPLGFLLNMQELGVMSGVGAAPLGLTFASDEPSRFIQVLRSHGRALVATHKNPDKTFTLEAYKVTDVGRRILRLGRFEAHDLYLRNIGKEIKGQGFNVSIGTCRDVSDGRFEILDEEAL